MDLLTIGELAAKTGVPVKTIRFYADEGLLPPRRVTAARYRLFAPEDVARLELIRTLRGLDFELDAIKKLLDRRRTASETLQLELTAVDAALRRLRRTRAVLAAAAGSAEPLSALSRLQAIAVLDRCEREAFLRNALTRHLAGIPVNATWQAWLHDAAFKDLPEELDDAQWRALIELCTLISDEDFGRSLARTARRFWTRARKFDPQKWQAQLQDLVGAALAAQSAGHAPDSKIAQELVDRWIGMNGRNPLEDHDPRAERFWELVSTIRGRGPSPQQRAFRYLTTALRSRLPA